MRLTGRRWLYALGLSVIIALIAVAFRIASVHNEWIEKVSKQQASLRNQSRTYVGRYPAAGHGGGSDFVAMLTNLRSMHSSEAKGVRFVAVPSCAGTKFAVSLLENGRGHLVTYASRKSINSDLIKNRREFITPAPVTHSVMREFDRLAPPWPGDAEFVLDGTEIAFERISAEEAFTGSGATSGYQHLGAAVRALLFPYVPELAEVDEMWLRPSEGC